LCNQGFGPATRAIDDDVQPAFRFGQSLLAAGSDRTLRRTFCAIGYEAMARHNLDRRQLPFRTDGTSWALRRDGTPLS
jgi:hypothetical protein